MKSGKAEKLEILQEPSLTSWKYASTNLFGDDISHYVPIFDTPIESLYIRIIFPPPSAGPAMPSYDHLDPLLKEVLIVCEATGRHVLSHLMRAHARPRRSQTERT